MKPDFDIVSAEVSSNAKNASTTHVKEKIDEIFDGQAGELTPELSRAVREVTKSDNGWRGLKRSGVPGLPGGQVREACDRLLLKLAELGIYVVPEGELERWVPSTGGKGPTWLAVVLEENQHLSPSTALAAFLAPIVTVV